jgi:hypothetical protein
MLVSITVKAEHIGGPCEVRVEAELEPNVEAWNEAEFSTIAVALNRLLAAMFAERDRIKFETEQSALRSHT